MSKSVKVRYDKRLKKHHVEYEKLKDQDTYRIDTYKKLNAKEDLAVLIETFLGSVNKPDQMKFTKEAEGLFAKYQLAYMVRPIEVQAQKALLGVFGGKKTETHYAITFIIPAGSFNEAMFKDFFCEFDLQIGYQFQKDVQSYFDDVRKGYVDNVFDDAYFANSFYDSRVFNKYLATEDIS